MFTLGLSSFTHDASAALLDGGVIRAAIEDSKLIRSDTHRLPEAAMRYCLEQGGIGWSDLEVVAVSSRPFRGWMRRSGSLLRQTYSSPLANLYCEANQLGALAKQLSDLRQLRHENGPCSFKLLCLEHHLCHAASAFLLSPFDRALIVTLDEEGDGKSGMVAIGEGNRIRVVQTISSPHSLGWVYAQITELLGFVPRQEEHKTQWLSAEGEPCFKEIFLEMLRKSESPLPHLNPRFVERDAIGRLKLSRHFCRRAGLPERGAALSMDERRAIASSLQQACFEIIRDLVRHFRRRYGVQNICLGGGLFQNVVLVAALEKELGMDQVFVPPAPGNAGCAVGAALFAWHHLTKKPRGEGISHVYWGPSYKPDEVREVIYNCKARYFSQNTEERRLDAAIKLLEVGKIIGWFQGAVEFGPRALGNRSLLASPWAPYVKENLNDYIKHREWFRPFAISIPEEDCSRFFECSRLCRFMNSLGTVRPGEDVLPDGFTLPGNQVRLHVVQEKANPLFWKLLKRFGTVAPAPMLINTSFNLAGEALVTKPQDAFRSYFCSGIDALVIGNFFLSKSPLPDVSKPQLVSTVKKWGA
jgi:carbamoyltransferase